MKRRIKLPAGAPSGAFSVLYADKADRLRALLEIAKALNEERELDRLLQRIVSEAARVVDADRGTLFLVDNDTNTLWSKIAQGVGGEIRIPRGQGIAGLVAESGTLVNLPDAYADPRFNPAVDHETGYHTQTLLCVPMNNSRGDVVGVLQLLNKFDGVFDYDDEELLMALGGQAASAVENALLHDEITQLFEGFVNASVVAIEARDPSTAGHSARVAKLTLGLCDVVELHGTPSWQRQKFLPAQRMELRYAALLHDFGKVGVREDVLVKANKLYPRQLELVRMRFALAKKSLEVEHLQDCVALLKASAAPDLIAQQDVDFAIKVAEIDAVLGIAEAANYPTVLQAGSFEALQRGAAMQFPAPDGTRQPLLTSAEIEMLSIPRGTLSAEERREIESHVSHTFNFLSQIPWSRGLRRVPEIAHGHHEKLNGGGYPLGLPATQIAIEPRMMAIADIYDALTASDRPYKKVVPHINALRILGDEAECGALDGELVELFCQARVPELVFGTAITEGRRISGVF
ncbi:MAG: GAF domain-containing protein [Myxococcales bacterium]|nr:GAF domain-containing protein [Myxococcales bacterium]